MLRYYSVPTAIPLLNTIIPFLHVQHTFPIYLQVPYTRSYIHTRKPVPNFYRTMTNLSNEREMYPPSS